ncbi:hypothetical protein DYU05_20560 [Mucilaginibacter terrenus]|uniref:Uncharacterized protein n=1 Tax=Mucilaginibacter terrenus TaxID=2482727 RepID=A0A3E2NJI0_9SPHI|nr:hypothetical protein [Mucilaginibacter terrenus]RFZ81152.1 hypothetical protein DYU05_20560 [Mucilaginibacter terrenus]
MASITTATKNKQILLSLRNRFINDYNLTEAVNSFYNHYAIDFGADGTFPYTFTPSIIIQDKQLEQYIHDYEDIVKGLALNNHQSDEIFFLAKTFESFSNEKEKQIIKENYLRGNGKLLVSLLKAPIKDYSLDSIYQAFDDEDLYPDEVNNIILSFLTIVTNKPIESFLDSDNQLDFCKLSTNEALNLVKEIRKQTNIRIDFRTGDKDINIYISKDVSTIFGYKENFKSRYCEPQSSWFKREILTDVVRRLFKEQESHNTDLYKHLCRLKEVFNPNAKELDNLVGNWNRESHKTHNFKAWYNILNSYLNNNGLLITKNKTNARRAILFLRLSIIFGFIDDSGHFVQQPLYNQVSKSLKTFNLKVSGTTNFSPITLLNNIFKNLSSSTKY